MGNPADVFGRFSVCALTEENIEEITNSKNSLRMGYCI
jgi:hypothetical protein